MKFTNRRKSLEAKVSALESRLTDLERKVNREREFESWRATRGSTGGQFGFSYGPTVGRPVDVT
jgi:hypothetical protein